jgi:hypothetical protein
MVDVIVPVIDVGTLNVAVFRFLQQTAAAVPLSIRANAIADTPGRTATRQHCFIRQLAPAFSNREVLRRCFREPYSA